MRTERPNLDGEVHCYRGRVPPGGCETFEYRIGGGNLVQMHRLRIIFGSETLDVAFGDLNLAAFEPHPYSQVIKPLNHSALTSPSPYAVQSCPRVSDR